MKHSSVYKIPSHVQPRKWFDVGVGDGNSGKCWHGPGVLGISEGCWKCWGSWSEALKRCSLHCSSVHGWGCSLTSVLSSPETLLVLDSHHSLAGRPPAAFHQPLCAPQLHCWVHLYSPSTIICRDSHSIPSAVALRLGTRSSAPTHQIDSITPSLLQLPLS